MLKINITTNRNRLVEGRVAGMGFGILKKIGRTHYETVSPISPCKDYLAEVVFTENTGVPSRAFGYEHAKKLGLFENTRYGYLAIQLCKDRDNNYLINRNYEADSEFLSKNFKNIEKLLNAFEKEIGIVTKTKIYRCKEGVYIIKGSTDWFSASQNISLYTLLIRTGQLYDGEMNHWEFISNYHIDIIDRSYLNTAIKNLKIITEKKELPPNRVPYNIKDGRWARPHDYGICQWDKSYELAEIIVKEAKLKS